MSVQEKIDLKEIQTLADELSKKDNPRPNFSVPEGCNTGIESAFIEIKDTNNKGKGFFAKQDIKAGTMLLGSKPISLVMGWEEGDLEDGMSVDLEEDDDDDDDEGVSVMKGSKRNGMLITRVAEAMKSTPSLWFDQINHLFPRETSEELPIWMCTDAATGIEIEKAIDALSQVNEFSEDPKLIEEMRQRLPLIVRYNCLSVETAPELFVHPNQEGGGHISLSGTGLYYYPSYFNHSHEPNVLRYAIGDVMFFVANQDISSGEELCISYIETEHLCESPALRSQLLDMDFEDGCGYSSASKKGDEDISEEDVYGRFPIVDIEMQEELMSLSPMDRLDELNELLTAATKGSQEADGDEDANGADGDDFFWFKCDVHQLRVLLALTLDSLGKSSIALEEWKKCIAFAEVNLPQGAFVLLFVASIEKFIKK